MPELAEVARVTHYLRQHLVGRTIKKFTAIEDNIVFKHGDVTSVFESQKVLSADRRGKYFWLSFDSYSCAVMHLGMAGWVHIQNHQTAPEGWYKKMNQDPTIWPPKFWKFHLETTDDPPLRVAFTDPRRLGRVMALDTSVQGPLLQPPLSNLGLDPIVDAEKITVKFLTKMLESKTGSIKGKLLDQTEICGIGNWLADEMLFQAGIHPSEICRNIVAAHVDESSKVGVSALEKLCRSILHVAKVAFDNLADDDEFPDDWLFRHRWSRGKKGPGVLPSGETLALVTVGGRTSCYAPCRQVLQHDSLVRELKPPKRLSDSKHIKEESEDDTKPKKARRRVKNKQGLNVKIEAEATPKTRMTRSRSRSRPQIQAETSKYFE